MMYSWTLLFLYQPIGLQGLLYGFYEHPYSHYPASYLAVVFMISALMLGQGFYGR